MKSPSLTSLFQAPQPEELRPNPLAFVGVVQTKPVRLCTLIKPTLIVLARHYQPIVGTNVEFRLNERDTFSAAIVKKVAELGDILIMQLGRVVPAEPAQIADSGDLAATAKYFVTGIEDPLGQARPVIAPATLRTSAGGYIRFRQDPKVSTIEKGDSGAPDLVLVDGRYKVIGPHYSINPAEWLTSALHPYADKIAAL